MRHWSRTNKHWLTRYFRVEHIAAKIINKILAPKEQIQGSHERRITDNQRHDFRIPEKGKSNILEAKDAFESALESMEQRHQ